MPTARPTPLMRTIDKPQASYAVTIFATTPVVVFAQKDNPAEHAPKPTLADVQNVVQTDQQR
jgi:hypothetical protein